MDSRIVLVTGGSSGIGAAAARILAESGMIVYSASRHGGESSVYDSGGRIESVVMDVNDACAIENTISEIVSREGRLDAVVSNAGNGIAGALEDTSEEEFRYQFETTFFGAVKTVGACIPFFRRQGHGKIITVSSVAGFVPIPYQGFYSCAKAALLMYTKTLSMEVKPYGISCCCILPGDTKTGFTKARKYTAKSSDKSSPYYADMHKSVGKMEKDEQNGMPPEKIARAILRQLRRKKGMSLTVIPRFDYKVIDILVRILPQKLVLRIVKMLY